MVDFIAYDRPLKLLLFYIRLGFDNLNTCEKNEMSVEFFIDFQFIRNVIRGIIIIIYSHYFFNCLQNVSQHFSAQ